MAWEISITADGWQEIDPFPFGGLGFLGSQLAIELFDTLKRVIGDGGNQ